MWPPISLPWYWIVVLDIVIWLTIQMSLWVISSRFPRRWFEKPTRFYQTASWMIWFIEHVLLIRVWQPHLPEGADTFDKNGFTKNKIKSMDTAYLEMYALETRRGEFSHYLPILFIIVFILFNPWWAMLIHLFYISMINMPCALSMRYNRYRIERILNRKRQITHK